jgi:hypothetical protein
MRAAVYMPFAADPPQQMTVVLRATRGAVDTLDTLRRVLHGLYLDVAASGGQALADVVARQMWLPRVARDIIGTFAVTAALLAFVGLYGVISYSIVRRRNELGIRLALGAAPVRVLRLVVRQGLMLGARERRRLRARVRREPESLGAAVRGHPGRRRNIRGGAAARPRARRIRLIPAGAPGGAHRSGVDAQSGMKTPNC